MVERVCKSVRVRDGGKIKCRKSTSAIVILQQSVSQRERERESQRERHTHTHARARAHAHAHTRTHTRARARSRTQAATCTDTLAHTQYITPPPLPLLSHPPSLSLVFLLVYQLTSMSSLPDAVLGQSPGNQRQQREVIQIRAVYGDNAVISSEFQKSAISASVSFGSFVFYRVNCGFLTSWWFSLFFIIWDMAVQHDSNLQIFSDFVQNFPCIPVFHFFRVAR